MTKKTIDKEVSNDELFLLQLTAFERLRCAFKMLCDLLNQSKNIKEKDPNFLNFDTTIVAYEMLITNYTFVLIGSNKSTDKISLFNEKEFQNDIVNFCNDNETAYNTLLKLRRKFFAHIDKVLLGRPQIDMCFANICIDFIKYLLHKKMKSFGLKQKEK